MNTALSNAWGEIERYCGKRNGSLVRVGDKHVFELQNGSIRIFPKVVADGGIEFVCQIRQKSQPVPAGGPEVVLREPGEEEETIQMDRTVEFRTDKFEYLRAMLHMAMTSTQGWSTYHWPDRDE